MSEIIKKIFSKKALFASALLSAFCFNGQSQAAMPRGDGEDVVTYESFKRIREKPNVLILDASYLEPLIHVTPKDEAVTGNGLTQSELDKFLKELIPSTDTQILLYCFQTSRITRVLPATKSVKLLLNSHGYENIYVMESLYKRDDGEFSSNSTENIMKKDVIPYTTKLPTDLKHFLENYYQKVRTPVVPSNATTTN